MRLNNLVSAAVLLGLSSGILSGIEPGSAGVNLSSSARANVYVAQSGAGSGSGANCANAKPATFFNTPANWGVGKPIGPGRIVGLCKAITSTLRVQGSGRSGKPITIYFMPGAKISQRACAPCLDMSERSFITVDGGVDGIIEGTDNGTTLGLHVPSIGVVASNCDTCEVKHLTIRGIYVHTGRGSEIDQTQMRAIAFTGDNFQVANNVIHDAGWAITFGRNGDKNDRVYGNDIYNVDHGVVPSFGSSGGSAGPFFVYDNHFHDFANWDTSNNAYHHDGIHCYTVAGGAAQHITDFYIYNNRFDGDIGNNATAWIFIEGSPRHDAFDTPCADSTSRLWIFNNFLTSTKGVAGNGIITLGSFGPTLVANNLIDGPDPKNPQSTCLGFGRLAEIYNNAIGGCNQLVTGPVPLALDYNAYAHCSGSFNCWWVGEVDTADFARHQAAGLDRHSVSNTAAATGSNAVGVGKNLSALCTGNLRRLCRDFTGALRPLRMHPDAGPFQRETAAITPNAMGRAALSASQSSIEQFYGRTRRTASRLPILLTFDLNRTLQATYRLHRGVLQVSYSGRRVVAIATTSAYYTTATGLGVGAPADARRLVGSGWRRCGLSLVRHQKGAAMAIRVSRGKVTRIALSEAATKRCG